MSEENVELFRRGADALERGSFDDALIEEIIDPELIFEPLRAPVSGTYRGHEGLRQFIADTAESFDVFRFNRADIRDLGDRVLAIGTLHIRARQGGIETRRRPSPDGRAGRRARKGQRHSLHSACLLGGHHP